MNLLSQLLFAVIISTVTSTLLLFTWWILRRCFMVVNPKLINVALRILCVTYLLPIGCGAILISKHRWLKGWGSTWKLYFARTKYITLSIQIIAIIWLVIVGIRVLLCMLQNKIWCRKLEDNIPIDGGQVAEVFYRVCQQMGIQEGKVSLQRNPLMESPMLVCLFHPQILLPEQEYSEDELELIFYHELSHYKHSDLKWKVFVIMITLLQGFNPLVYPLISIVSFWSECMADVSALETSGNINKVKWYFEKIESLMPEPKERKKKDKYLFAALYRRDKTMVRRVEFVQRYQHAHICSRRTSVGVLIVFLLASVIISAEAGIRMADLHKFVYKVTENNSDIEIMEDGMTEYFIGGEGRILTQQLASISPEKKRLVAGENHYYLEWEIRPDVCQVTGDFQVKTGQSIDVSAGVRFCWPDYWVGILDEKGHACYVEGDGSVFHNFKIAKAGKYRVFVKNNSVNEAISYIFVSFKVMDCE